MTTSLNPPGSGYRFRPAHLQSPVPLDEVLHSANAGFIVHRSAQICNEFREEGLHFAAQMVELINPVAVGAVSVFLYEELFGTHNRLHWMLHLKQPNDYSRLLDMVDHDQKWREVADMDRLPTKGGGGWDRIFVEGTIAETVMCPQHGLGHGDDHHHDTFQPAAMYQTALPPERLLHSANSAVTVHRTYQARYGVREEARLFLYEWAGYVNESLDGRATAFLYEEMWGRQDRLHLLIHLSSLEAYGRLLDLVDHDAGMHDLLGRQWVPTFKGGGGWQRLFIDGSIAETVLVPRHRSDADSAQ
ncbi:MAG TPA: DUF6039 family protein [Micromonosporaceae bacterium]